MFLFLLPCISPQLTMCECLGQVMHVHIFICSWLQSFCGQKLQYSAGGEIQLYPAPSMVVYWYQHCIVSPQRCIPCIIMYIYIYIVTIDYFFNFLDYFIFWIISQLLDCSMMGDASLVSCNCIGICIFTQCSWRSISNNQLPKPRHL